MKLGNKILHMRPIHLLLLPVFILCVSGNSVFAQGGAEALLVDLKAQEYTVTEKNASSQKLMTIVRLEQGQTSLRGVLESIAGQAGLELSYSEQLIPVNKKVDLGQAKLTAKQALWRVLEGTSLRYGVSPSGQLFFFDMEKESAPVQLESVSGTVTDATSGEPLPGVNVVVKGTTMGTSTDSEGSYQLGVPSLQDTLVFSFVGYQTREVPVQGRTGINIALQPQAISGEEMVVVGYSSQRKMDLTGAVDVADVENMQSLGAEQVTEELQGQVSGVSINTSGQPGDQPQINIRGFNTFGNNQPLFIVDGVPTQDISFLESNNIESLQVLKDAGAASQYGARASNGVIVITTKQGSGGISVNYNSSFGYQVPKKNDPYDILSPQEQGELEWLARENSGMATSHPIWGSGASPDVPEWILPARADNPNTDDYFLIPEYKDADQLSEFNQLVRANQGGTNWYSALTRPARQTHHNLSIGGGDDTGNYMAALSYTNQQGTVLHTSLERYTVRANTEFFVSDNISIGENLTYSVSENLQAGTHVGRNALGFVYNMHTVIPVHDIRGNFAGTQVPGLGTAQNPVALRERTRNDKQQSRRLFGNVFAEIDLLNNLTFRTNVGADLNTGFWETFQFPTYEQAQNNTTNGFTKETQWMQNWNWTNQLNYEAQLGEKHNISVMAAAEANRNVLSLDEVSRTDYFSFDEDYIQLATGSGTPTVNRTLESASTLLSLIFNANYNYDNKYLLGLTLRRDGSSKFINNQWGTFPAVTAGWRLSEMSFLEDVTWLSDLKIRGGYGVMGNQLNVSPNNGFTLFGGTPQTSYYPIEGGSNNVQQGIRQVRIGNPNAKWERNEDINIGLDFAFLEGRFEGTVDLYQKNVEGLLFNPALPATAGAAAPPVRNVASMRNQGIDVSFSGRTNITENLAFDGQLNFTTYRNEIRSIAQGVGQFDVGVVRNEVGYPISSFFGYDIVGFWQSQDEIQQADDQAPDGQYMQHAAPGRFRYRDANGDNEITPDDRVHLGSPHPDFTYGLNLKFTYKNWDFTAFIYGEEGKEIWNQTKKGTDFRGTFNTATSDVTLYDSWTPDNRDAKAPIQEINQYFSTSGANNSYFVEDASYMRVKNLQLGYTLPVSLFKQADNIRLYVRATNVFMITPYSGLDPDIGATQSAVDAASQTGGRVQTGATNFGVDRGGYPSPRTFMGGINISF